MLIAEDLLLLVTDDETGKLVVSAGEVDIALGGGLLIELAILDRVDLAGPSDDVREGRLVVRDRRGTSDEVLDEALELIGRKEGKKPQDVVVALGKGLRVRLYDRLTTLGILREEGGRILGLIPTHRWPTQHAEHEAALRRDVVAALQSGVAGTEQAGALISLLRALKAVHKAFDPDVTGLSKRQTNANVDRIAEGQWGSEGVRRAIDAMHAAVIAAASATAVSSGSS